MKSYTVNEIFYSPQGEGVRAGIPHIFVRFAGCNQTCKIETHGFDCDTDFTSGTKLPAGLVKARCDELHPTAPILFTGGEPCLQLDRELLGVFHHQREFVLETNGSVEPIRFDPLEFRHITVSPKSADHTLRFFQRMPKCEMDYMKLEMRYVRSLGQPLPKTRYRADHWCISPAFNADGTLDMDCLQHCIELVKENPKWRLSVQQHKMWRVR